MHDFFEEIWVPTLAEIPGFGVIRNSWLQTAHTTLMDWTTQLKTGSNG